MMQPFALMARAKLIFGKVAGGDDVVNEVVKMIPIVAVHNITHFSNPRFRADFDHAVER